MEGPHYVEPATGKTPEHPRYSVTVTPAYGRPFTVYVIPNPASKTGEGYITTASPRGTGRYAAHKSIETAVKSANYRVRRYLKHHSRPLGIQATQVTP